MTGRLWESRICRLIVTCHEMQEGRGTDAPTLTRSMGEGSRLCQRLSGAERGVRERTE